MLVILGIMMRWLNLNTSWMHCEYCDAMVINWVCLWFKGGSLELVLGQSLFFCHPYEPNTHFRIQPKIVHDKQAHKRCYLEYEKNNKIILISPTNKKLQFKNIHWYQNKKYYLWVILAILFLIFFDAIVKRNINTH